MADEKLTYLGKQAAEMIASGVKQAVADVSESEAEYNYTYTDYTVINPMPTMVMREKSKVSAFFGWVKGKLLTVESMASVAYDRIKSLVTYSFSTGEDKDGAIRVTKFSGGLVTSEDVQISNYGDTDISNIGDGTLTGAIKAASESGGGLRIVPINQEAYIELPQDQQDRDDIIWDVYDEDYEVTSKDIFFDWSGTTLTKDNVEDVIKELDSRTTHTISDIWDANVVYFVGSYCIWNGKLWRCKVQNSGQTPVDGDHWTYVNLADVVQKNTSDISNLNSTMETKAGFPDFGHVGDFESGFTFNYDGYALFRGRCEVTKTLLYRVYINDVLVLTRSQVPYSNDEFMASGLIPIKKGQRVTFEVGCVDGTLYQFNAYRIPCAN